MAVFKFRGPEDYDSHFATSIFSKYVKEIYYDGTIYNQELLNVLNDDRCRRKYVRNFLKNKSRIIWPKNAIRYAISQYKARFKEQIELQAYGGAHLSGHQMTLHPILDFSLIPRKKATK